MDRIDEKIIEAYDTILTESFPLNEGKLTKKDFDGLAGILKSAKEINQLKSNIVDWASTMNPMFNAEKFKKAAGISESTEIVVNEDATADAKKSLDAIIGATKDDTGNDIYKMAMGMKKTFEKNKGFSKDQANWIYKTSVAMFK